MKYFSILLFIISSMTLSAQSDVYERDLHISGNDTLPYRFLRAAHHNEGQKHPLVIFLHGAGERGNDNKKQLIHGSEVFADPANRNAFNYIGLFPQCPEDDYWANLSGRKPKFTFDYSQEMTKPLQMVVELIEKYIASGMVDTNRIYVTGLSMGGMGTFELISRRPDLFAAAIPICGGGDRSYADKFSKEVALWVIHGAKDNVVPAINSIEMVQGALDAGGFPRFTLYENANHNSWDPAFAEDDYLRWLFGHVKSSN